MRRDREASLVEILIARDAPENFIEKGCLKD